jgi:hypothetical protein
MTARSRRTILLAALVVAMVALGGAAGATALSTGDSTATVETVESGPADATVQNGTVDDITVDATFVGAVADEGTVTVEASGLLDGGDEPVDGERVTVTVGGEPVTTADVESGTLVTTFEPAVLDLGPQDAAAVGIHGFETADAPTVEVVHEVVGLEAGYTPHSVPQGATLVTSGVAALNVWDGQAGTYDAVTDPVFDTPDDLNRALYVTAASDDARLGHTFETDGPPVPGQEPLAEGWNFVGSNFDIDTNAGVTVGDDLVGIDATEHDIFTADFGAQLDPDDTVGAYDGYWVLVDGADVERGTVTPTYDSESREDALGIGAPEFQVTGVDVATSGTGSGGLVEVTATVENQGDALDTQFVDLLAENDTGGFERVDRTGLELDSGDSQSATLVHEVDETNQFDITVATDDHEMTETVTWDDPFFAVSDLSAPAQADEGENITVTATVENTGFADGTQDVVFRLDEFGNFDDPAVEEVAAADLQLAPGESQAVGLTVDAPAAAGEFEHGLFTGNDSQTATLLVGDNQVEGRLSDETVTLDGGVSGASTVTTDFTIESTDDAQRDVRAYELDVTFDPTVVSFVDAGLAAFPENASLVVNDENADQGHVRLVAVSTEQALTPVTAGALEFDPVAAGETTLTIDPGESDIEGPGGEARNPVWTNGSLSVES